MSQKPPIKPAPKSNAPRKGARVLRDLSVKNAEQTKGGKPPPIPPKKPCWVARAVYGEHDPRWRLFRSWLMNEAPPRFRASYLRYGECVARHIAPHPTIRAAIRWWMDRVIERSSRA